MKDYFGHGLTPRENEIRSYLVAPEHRQQEAALVATRWFDYSMMHPTEATYFYAHCYKLQTAIYYETFIDARKVENVRAFTPDDVLMGNDKTSMWLARCAADALGIHYPFVLQFAQHRSFDRTYQTFPRPNQLYGEEFEIDLLAAWQDSLARTITYSRIDRYKASNFKGSIWQSRHQAFVIRQIKTRPSQAHVNLLGRMFQQDVLSAASLTDSFSQETINAACQVAVKLDSQS